MEKIVLNKNSNILFIGDTLHDLEVAKSIGASIL